MNTTHELVSLAKQELGIAVDTIRIQSIFDAWTIKHIQHLVDDQERYEWTVGPISDDDYRRVCYREFMRESRDFDNHKWLTDNLK